MTDTQELETLIKKSGLKKVYIAKQLDISPYGLALKIKNVNEFTTGEVDALCRLLNIKSLKEKERIFFAKRVD